MMLYPNIKDKDGDLHLHLLINSFDRTNDRDFNEILLNLLEYYPSSPNIKNNYGITPLDIANISSLPKFVTSMLNQASTIYDVMLPTNTENKPEDKVENVDFTLLANILSKFNHHNIILSTGEINTLGSREEVLERVLNRIELDQEQSEWLKKMLLKHIVSHTDNNSAITSNSVYSEQNLDRSAIIQDEDIAKDTLGET